jgi:hypothetical protein
VCEQITSHTSLQPSITGGVHARPFFTVEHLAK